MENILFYFSFYSSEEKLDDLSKDFSSNYLSILFNLVPDYIYSQKIPSLLRFSLGTRLQIIKPLNLVNKFEIAKLRARI